MSTLIIILAVGIIAIALLSKSIETLYFFALNITFASLKNTLAPFLFFKSILVPIKTAINMLMEIKTGAIKIQTNQTFILNRDNIGNQIEAIPLQVIRKIVTSKQQLNNSINYIIIFSSHKNPIKI